MLLYLARRGLWISPVLIIGNGALARRLAEATEAKGTSRIIGYLDDSQPEDRPYEEGGAAVKGKAGGEGKEDRGGDTRGGEMAGYVRLGGTSDLARVVTERGVEEVLIAMPRSPREKLAAIIEECYRCHVRWRLVPDVYDLMFEHMDLSLAGDIPLLGTRGSRIVGLNFAIKRLFDIVVSLAMIVLFALLMIAIAAAIKLTSPGPVFFRQERVGYRGRRFKLLKFRSMRQDASSDDHRQYVLDYMAGRAAPSPDGQFKLADDPRVTAVGRIIRKFSLDELPQLFNVLKGEMSLIGPRPPLPYEVEAYEPRHLRRLDVLPGISGLWQVSGRNRLTFEEMIRLDLYYIENWSLDLDLRIFLRTIPAVLFSRAH